MSHIDDEDLREAVVRLLIVKADIETHTARRPTAIMLPPSLGRNVTMFGGLPVMRGDRTALIFEPLP